MKAQPPVSILHEINVKTIHILPLPLLVHFRIRDTDILIIDEVSMVSAWLLNHVHKKCQEARGDMRVFGNMQVGINFIIA